ncbi:hypothetical protein ASE01_04770 [Nocardioides sp. Root190]|uniref:hypothetical protein n=1 Tax=Nocardioides sp. Root190 TaxID=1736488 RepID=UPI0006FC4406|nr:hypothetical protein [Nocardioides sp. Root190]KRB78574.1 hypothetical protein ASE01_04770 [Nocardioides sp. Root190]
MSGPGRRWLVGAVLLGVLTALVAAVVSVLSLRAPGPAEVAEDYLASSWNGDWRTECDLATKEWRRADLFAGYPFADCAAFADAAEEASGEGGFLDFADDTDIDITVQTVNDDDGRARVEYLIEFRYDGPDREGFDALWQGGGALDRGTVELVDVDGAWRVAGVDAG